jgi:ribosomal protein L21
LKQTSRSLIASAFFKQREPKRPMAGFKDKTFQERRTDAGALKQATLAKLKAATDKDNPAVIERLAKQREVEEARQLRLSQRAAEKAAEAERLATLAAEAEIQRKAEIEAAHEAEVEAAALLEMEQQAARDARYAARKAAKKAR